MKTDIPTTTTQNNTQPIVTKEFNAPPGMTTATQKVWLYQNDEKRVEGPWKLSQMIEWYKSGFFEDNVQVRKTNDVRTGWNPIVCWKEIVGIEKAIPFPKEKETKNKGKNQPKSDSKKGSLCEHDKIYLLKFIFI